MLQKKIFNKTYNDNAKFKYVNINNFQVFFLFDNLSTYEKMYILNCGFHLFDIVNKKNIQDPPKFLNSTHNVNNNSQRYYNKVKKNKVKLKSKLFIVSTHLYNQFTWSMTFDFV